MRRSAYLESLFLLRRLVVDHFGRFRSCPGIETCAPVIDFDILIQNAQALVDHERRQYATELREAAPHLYHDSGVGVVPCIEKTYRSVVFRLPGRGKRGQVHEAIVVDGRGVKDPRFGSVPRAKGSAPSDHYTIIAGDWRRGDVAFRVHILLVLPAWTGSWLPWR